MLSESSGMACTVLREPADISDTVHARWLSLMGKCASPHFSQGPSWFRSFQRESGHFAVVTDIEGEFRALSVIRESKLPLIAKSKYFIECGPVATDLQSFATHLQQLRAMLGQSALWIRLAPYVVRADCEPYHRTLVGERFVARKRSMGYSATVVVDLQPSLDEIRRRFRRSLKTQLNKSERVGVEVYAADSPEEFAAFMRNLNAAKGNAPGTGMAGMDGGALFRNFIADDRGICLVARLDGRVVAGILVLAAGERAVYQWGYSDTNLRRVPLSHRLHWEALKWAKAKGFTKYDLGGYWLERGDSDPINRFKTGFSQQIDELCDEFELTLAPVASAIFNSAEQIRMRWAGLRYRSPMGKVGTRAQGA